MTTLNSLLKDFVELKNNLAGFVATEQKEVDRLNGDVELIKEVARKKVERAEEGIKLSKKEIAQAKKAKKQIEKITGGY